jgi:hypothetical protein
MVIPDTPQALIEGSSEAMLTVLHEGYESLNPRDQRLVRLINGELLKGELSDTAFAQMLITIVNTWQTLSSTALAAVYSRIESEDEIDTDWIDAVAHFTRMDQYQSHLLMAIRGNPGVSSEEPSFGRYTIQGPGDG